ncbi:MAG: NADH:flavin oxidoreductase [Deltaproteobacteria bacterium]|nr:NADH:flavin oxidoreductase [Deltaproteobacteria bacterium]
MQIKNRLVKAAIVENLATEDGQVTDELIRLYDKAARGGAGLIITGGAFVQKSGRNVRFQTGAHGDESIPGLARLARAGQKNDTRIVLQISHGGRQCPPSLVRGDVIGPSPVRDQLSKIMPRAMTEDEIEETIEAFGRAAGRAREAGFDGVEIMAGHGYLINEFLSRRTNHRRDRWGGSLENRAGFYFRIIQCVRKTVGEDFPILTKINTEDQMKNGFSLDECGWVVHRLPELGVAAVKLTGGTYESALNIARGDIPEDEILGDLNGWQRFRLKMIVRLMRRRFRFSEAYFLDNAKQIGRNLDTPVILVGGLRTPGLMEDILQKGYADMIALGRPLIRQPDWPNRILAGDSRPSSCINCNRCFIRISKNQPVGCYETGVRHDHEIH